MRHEAGLTQRALGEQLGRPYSYVYKCEAGERRVDPLELILWSWACGFEPGDVTRSLAEKTPRPRPRKPLRPRKTLKKFPRTPARGPTK